MEARQIEENWLSFSSLNKETFSAQLTGMSLANILLSHPFIVLSVRQQAGPSITGVTLKKGNVFNQLHQTYKSIGLRGLYRGCIAMTAVGVPSEVIYLGVMESSREYFQKELRKTFPNASPVAIDVMQTAASAVLSNFVSLVPYVPAEVLISRLIVSQAKEGVTNRSMIQSIYRESGVRGFFKGFTSSFLVGTVVSTQWWWSYSTCKRYTPLLPFYEKYKLLVDGASGLVAGLSAAAVAHPIDTVKTIIMSSSSSSSVDGSSGGNSGFVSTLVRTVKQEGVMRLYKGLPAVMYLTALGSSVFAFSYEFIKSSSCKD